MRWDGPIRRGPGGWRHASCREESSARLLWRVSGPGRVHASLLVPYCTLALAAALITGLEETNACAACIAVYTFSPPSLPRRRSAVPGLDHGVGRRGRQASLLCGGHQVVRRQLRQPLQAPYSFPAGVSAASAAIISRVAASTACCHRWSPNLSA